MGRDPDAGKDCRQNKKRATEVEMVGCHHRLDGLKLGQTLGVGDGQGSLVHCDTWGFKEPDMTEQLNKSNQNYYDRLPRWHHVKVAQSCLTL